MIRLALEVSGLTRAFNRRTVFAGVDIVLRETDSLTVTGRNGSGKSTLLKMLAGVLSPSRGSIDLSLDSKPVTTDQRFRYIGFVAPYLQLYDEFSAIENLKFVQRIRGLQAGEGALVELLKRLGLKDRMDDPLRTFSSGMKQRVKYAFALIHDPPVLLLDEPTANLDAAGIDAVYETIEAQKRRGIVIVATTNSDEIRRCARILDLDTLGQRSSTTG